MNLQLRWAKTDSSALGGTHVDTWNLFYQKDPLATGTQVAWVNAGPGDAPEQPPGSQEAGRGFQGVGGEEAEEVGHGSGAYRRISPVRSQRLRTGTLRRARR